MNGFELLVRHSLGDYITFYNLMTRDVSDINLCGLLSVSLDSAIGALQPGTAIIAGISHDMDTCILTHSPGFDCNGNNDLTGVVSAMGSALSN